ncbi:hypothetical protein B0E53_04966 [Micromonospora sp. MH33]|uniref:hypothetical protein n=1 Tax=Micromonospora sp. MH33 TaxID=1945509 RepID=UPI000D1495B6|nr:hypothetical protein [Micromonospora sp. MH33]PSK63097.1 hypothetical protein B0E53_04966 [Micromonospora sp. MH33]
MLRRNGYGLHPDQVAAACTWHPEQVCQVLAEAGRVAAAQAQITALTDAAHLLCDIHSSASGDILLSLRAHLDQVADALTKALAHHDQATAALRGTCEGLIHTDIPLVAVCDPNSTNSPDDVTEPTP